MRGHGFNPRWSNFLFILWVFRFHNFISKMSQESQVNLNFADYDRLGLRLFAISISPQSEEKQVWPVGCLRAGCKIGRYQKWQRRLILKNQTVCISQVQPCPKNPIKPTKTAIFVILYPSSVNFNQGALVDIYQGIGSFSVWRFGWFDHLPKRILAQMISHLKALTYSY